MFTVNYDTLKHHDFRIAFFPFCLLSLAEFGAVKCIHKEYAVDQCRPNDPFYDMYMISLLHSIELSAVMYVCGGLVVGYGLHTHALTHTKLHTRPAHTHIHARTHARIRTRAHARTRAHTHTHAHTHTLRNEAGVNNSQDTFNGSQQPGSKCE